MPPLAAALLLAAFHWQTSPPPPDCREWPECRQMALAAAAAGEYERFHDLAWRTVQTGPKNDPDLMYLLARAMSLSGRPGDAIVILQRLAGMGVTTDAASNEDFRRVRNLPAWSELTAGKGPPTSIAAPRAEPVRPAPAGTTVGTGGLAGNAAASGAHAVRFSTLPFTPAGLAYDGVSRRFIIGDRRARRLAVVDEFSQHVANLASAQTAGFGDIVALEIDPRQGDLWVASAGNPGATLHKLQLISGRALASFTPAEEFGAVDVVDITATPDRGVLVLDRRGHRVFQLRPKAAALELLVTLPDGSPASLAAAGDAVFVAHANGISRVDLATRNVGEVKPPKGTSLTGITRLRSHRGSLIAVQRAADGAYTAIRIELDPRGTAVASVRPLNAPIASIDPTAVAVSGGVLYYLAAADEAQMTVRKVTLK